ncbi:MAG: XdhC family protein [Deltaproteobacteria bacterium]|nr:XdhC family protein [Deltaproteobacteria bacterium]
MADIFDELALARAHGQGGVMAVVTAVRGHAPQVVGARLLRLDDGRLIGTIGGGRVEQVVLERAEAVAASGRAGSFTFNLQAELGMCCGGQMEVFVEPVEAPPRLYVFGAGHVARPTAALAARCGFRVTVIDERPDWNSPERFADAERLVEPHGDVLERLELGPRDLVVITTHNHDHDREILGCALRTEAGYVGMIGSVRKVHKALAALRVEGLDDATLARAHTPIGLDICAETPDEIAVSIVGELIRHRRAASSLKKTRGAPVEHRSEAG